jgi:hypothetical protein
LHFNFFMAGQSKHKHKKQYNISPRANGYRKYKREVLEAAILQLRQKPGNIRNIADAYGIPKSTLADKLTTKGPLFPDIGRRAVLSAQGEARLLKWIKYMCTAGFPVSPTQVKAAATRLHYLLTGHTHKFGKTWWSGFTKRHPEAVMKRPQRLDPARLRATSAAHINPFFELVKELYQEKGYEPHDIWNYDETGFILEGKVVKLVGIKGVPMWQRSANNRKYVSIGAAINAANSADPPMFIWPQKTVPAELFELAPPASAMIGTDTGYSKDDVFLRFFEWWLGRHVHGRPSVMCIDGHESHVSLEIVEKALAHGVHLVCFPSHVTHILQPLDVGCFGPLKRRYHIAVNDWVHDHDGTRFNDSEFLKLFTQAWNHSMTPVNISASWQATGLFPLDPLRVSAKVANYRRKKPIKITDIGDSDDECSNATTVQIPAATSEAPHSKFAQPQSSAQVPECGDNVWMSFDDMLRKAMEASLAEAGVRAAHVRRLQQRMELYHLKEVTVIGDGNCFFRVLSQELWDTEDRHLEVRAHVVDHMIAHADFYRTFVTQAWDTYVSDLSQASTWADHVAMQAAAEAYHACLWIMSSIPGDQYISIIEPALGCITRSILLSHPPNHFNLLLPTEQASLVTRQNDGTAALNVKSALGGTPSTPTTNKQKRTATPRISVSGTIMTSDHVVEQIRVREICSH